MVAVSTRNQTTEKSSHQYALENMRNRQSASMRYRKDTPVSLKENAPWETDDGK